MRPRVVAVAAAAAALLLYLLWSLGRPSDSGNAAEGRRPTAPSPPSLTVAEPASPPAPRNVFEYVDGGGRPSLAAPSVTGQAPVPAASPEAPVPSPPPVVRLVGILRQGTRLKAALTIAGETVVLAPGESSAGYTVLAIDEEDGVRIRIPEGGTIVVGDAAGPWTGQ